MNKLELLKKYIALQAEDDGLWFIAEHASEALLQQELRRVAWLIEEATEEQVKTEIKLYMARLAEQLGNNTNENNTRTAKAT